MRPTTLGTCLSIVLGALTLAIGAGAPAAAETAKDTALLVTYGPRAAAAEGDDDHHQVVFLRVPADYGESLFVRLFDPDTGGARDTSLGDFDTTTHFYLYGGAGAFTGWRSDTPAAPSAAAVPTGTLLRELEVGVDPARDNEWSNLAEVKAADGEPVDGMAVFRLDVVTVAGDDGNVWDVAVSTSDSGNRPLPGAQMLSPHTTVRVPKIGLAAEIRLALPKGVGELTVMNFDAAGTTVTLDSGWRSAALAASGQGDAREQKVSVAELDPGAPLALTVGGQGGEEPNDVTVAVRTSAGEPVLLEHPAQLGRRNARPQAKAKVSPLADCFSVVFDGAGTVDPDGDLVELAWDFGDGGAAKGNRVVHRYAAPGTYRGRLVVTDSSGWVSDAAAADLDVVVNRPPVAAAGADQLGEPGRAVAFEGAASSDADGTIQRYLWDFGDGTTGEGRAATHAYAEPGKYTVSLRVEDDSIGPCNFAVDSLAVAVNYPPVAEAGEDVLCSVGESIELDASRSYDTDGKVTSFAWDLGDGTRAGEAKVQHVYAKPGVYKAKLEVHDDSGATNSRAADELTVYVNDPPVAVAGADRRLAIGEVSTFDGSGSLDRDGKLIAYTWDFGDGHTGKGRVVPYAYSAPGKYAVTLTVRDNSPAASGVGKSGFTVLVNAPPVAEAGEKILVTTTEVQFDGSQSSDADGRIATYDWDFGDGTQGQGAKPLHAYARPGTYQATLRVTDDSPTPANDSVDRVLAVVNQRPVADAGANQIGAPGQTLTFNGADSFDPDGEIVAFEWTFGDGGEATGQKVTHAFAQPGVYAARLTVRDDTGQKEAADFDERLVTVNAPPTAKAGPDVLVAPGEEVVLDGGGSFDVDGALAHYQWRFSDGKGGANTAATRRAFPMPGVFGATLTVVDDSGAPNDSASDELTIRVNHPPQAVPGDEVYTCDSRIAFDGSQSTDGDGDALAYRWDFGDGSQAEGRQVTHVFASEGSFPVTLTVDDGTRLANGSHTAATKVVINGPPVASAGAEKTACAGKTVLFDGTGSRDPEGGLLKLTWDMGDGTRFEGPHPTKIFNEAGVYVVKLTAEDDSGLACNRDEAQVVVRVAESPVADAGPDLVACAGSPVRFDGSKSTDADGVVNNFSWEFGDGTRGGGATPEHDFAEPGSYKVTLQVTGDQIGTCDNLDTDETMVTVMRSPLAKIVVPDRVALGVPVSFDGSTSTAEGSEITSWKWDFGDGASATGKQVKHAYAKPGRYVASLAVSIAAQVACSTVSSQKVVLVNEAPVAVAGADRTVGVDQPVAFDATGSKDPDGALVGYDWSFADGGKATGVLARHRFAKSGRYPVVLTVTDDSGVENGRSTATVNVIVNAAPEPVLDLPKVACVGQEAELSAARSQDADGKVQSVVWSFGDGGTAEGPTVRHTFQRAGRYSVTALLDDGTQVTNSQRGATIVLPVNQPPSAAAGPDRIVCPGQPVAFDGSASADGDGTIAAYRWDFGDGAAAEGAKVAHAYAQPGRFEARLAVTDDLGGACGTTSDSAAVRVNSTPVAVAGGDRQASTGGAHDDVLFDASASSDGDGDPLTYLWDFGDGSAAAGARVFHVFAKPGSYKVELKVKDGSGVPCGEAVQQVTVDVRGRAGTSPAPVKPGKP